MEGVCHFPNGNSGFMVVMVESVMFLTLWIAFSDVFARCCLGGTYWMVISLHAHIRVNATEVSLSSLSHFVVIFLRRRS